MFIIIILYIIIIIIIITITITIIIIIVVIIVVIIINIINIIIIIIINPLKPDCLFWQVPAFWWLYREAKRTTTSFRTPVEGLLVCHFEKPPCGP